MPSSAPLRDAPLPRVSIVTPSFNQARFLEETMKSIHGAGYPNLEHIVMDGGSTDGSVEIIRSYEDRLAYWVSEPDGGQAAAIAAGFERSTGEILCWLNSDDVYEASTLFDVADFFERNPAVQFVYGDAVWIDAGGRELKNKREHAFNRFVFLWDHNFIPQPSTFWRRSLYFDVGGVDPSFVLAMDADLWIRFSERTRPVHVSRQWSRMRFYPEQKMVSLREQNATEIERIRRRYVREVSPTGARARQAAARALRVGLKAVAGGYSFSESVLHARGYLSGRNWEERETRRVRSAE